MDILAEILEITMIVCFGLSWPVNLVKNYKIRSAKGMSLPFLLFIFFGYIAGITSKFVNEAYMTNFATKWYVLIFYFINLIMLALNICVYFRNRLIDNRQASKK